MLRVVDPKNKQTKKEKKKKRKQSATKKHWVLLDLFLDHYDDIMGV